ncbi:MAG: hypothetical protein ACOC2H_09355 [Spirochaetota bacterium]
MKKNTLSIMILILICVLPIAGQEPTGNGTGALQSENLERETDRLNKNIVEFATKIEEAVQTYNLMDAEGVQILPYRMDYKKEDDHITMTRHTFIRKDISGEIIGIKTKTFKIYGTNENISKFESVITEKNYMANQDEQVIMVDPTPTSEETGDITFTQIINGNTVVEGKKLSEIRNSAAFPVANSIKRDFYVPHLSFFYYAIRTIGETYNKNRKDTDTMLTDFLTESTEY